MTVDATEPKAKWYHVRRAACLFWRWGPTGLLVLLLLAAVLAAWINRRGRAALDAALQRTKAERVPASVLAWEARQRGLAWSSAGHGSDGAHWMGRTTLVPARDNAARRYLAVFPLLDLTETERGDLPWLSRAGAPARREAIHPETLAAARAFLATHANAYALLDAARAQDRCDFPAWALEVRGDRPHALEGLRRVQECVAVRRLVAEAEQDASTAFDGIAHAIDVADALEYEPGKVAALVQVSLRAHAWHSAEAVLSRLEPPSPSAARALARRFDRPPIDAPAILGSEVAWFRERLRTRSIGYLTMEMALRMDRIGASMSSALQSALASTLPSSNQEIEPIYELHEGQIVVTLLVPGFARSQLAAELEALLDDRRWLREAWRDRPGLLERSRDGAIRSTTGAFVRTVLDLHACERVTAAALRIEAHRMVHGEWPSTVTDADPEATDPFDGEPLRLLRDEEGLLVYSVGSDGEDDGGRMDYRDGDIGFRLYTPEQRGVLPPVRRTADAPEGIEREREKKQRPPGRPFSVEDVWGEPDAERDGDE